MDTPKFRVIVNYFLDEREEGWELFGDNPLTWQEACKVWLLITATRAIPHAKVVNMLENGKAHSLQVEELETIRKEEGW